MKIKDIIDEAAPLYYRGYPCTKDCSGHAAGYRWAQRKGIVNVQDCPYRLSHNSFWEGCKSKAEGK